MLNIQLLLQYIRFSLKIRDNNLPQSKNFRISQKFPRTMSAHPRLSPCLLESSSAKLSRAVALK